MVHVSKLEMRGFKSFGHKKESFPLASGLTAIVGPNGSGKSNIVDALSFVLGQMSSKTLRASEFADLIYHGGEGEEGKKPAPYAKVRLYISDNNGALPIDSENVTVSRRVNKDGKSTYRINGSRSTRQEIMDLLSGEIIGSEGYNFVMQGDVGKFIKMSSLERRKIIDDLAGVAEFEEKKSHALTELEEVETNLQSERGRLEELEQNMEKLEREREEAIEFKELQSEITKKKASLAHIAVGSCEERLSDIQDKIEVKDEELRELEEKRESARSKQEDLRQNKSKYEDEIREKRESEVLSEVGRIRSRIETLDDRREDVEMTYGNLVEEIEEIQREAEDLADKSEEKSPLKQIEKFSVEFHDLHESFNEKTEILTSAEVGSDQFENSLETLTDLLDDLASVLSDLEEHLQRALKSREDFMELAEKADQIEEAGSEFDKLRSRLTSTKARRDDYKEQIEELTEKIENSEESLAEAESAAADIKEEIDFAKDKVSEFEGRINELGDDLENLDKKIDSVKDERGDLRAEKASAETELRQAREDLRNYYQVDEKELIEGDREKLERDVEELEKDIQKLKPINERAIEGYKEVKERYDSQKDYYSKLEEEKQSLLEFMEEIDEKKAEVFMDTFEEVSENFSEIFSGLSPGGTGNLALENPEDPLEGGLRIEVKPKGKKLGNAASLSGGEKALTGLAFIFAIQRSQPSGLYVLDEIDAHLDPENQKEVAKMVNQFSRESQIIVVTLRDSMMAAADKLFGVNMDEENISHVVSVDLEEMKEEN